MNGIIGKKIGMTSIYVEGTNVPCTVIEAGPCVVTQIKTEETDGYNSMQLSYGEKKKKRASAPELGHFKKAKTDAKAKSVEFRNADLEKKLGENVLISDVFEEGDLVNAIGTSKGKGFQGVVKRHGFGGVGQRTHGQHNRERAPGSIGAASYPAKVIKGMKMAGQTGNKRVKIKNLEVVKILEDKHLVLIKGAVPGHKGSLIILEK